MKKWAGNKGKVKKDYQGGGTRHIHCIIFVKFRLCLFLSSFVDRYVTIWIISWYGEDEPSNLEESLGSPDPLGS